MQYLKWSSLWQKRLLVSTKTQAHTHTDTHRHTHTHTHTYTNTRRTCQIYSKLTIKTPEQRPVLLLLTLNTFRTLIYCCYCWIRSNKYQLTLGSYFQTIYFLWLTERNILSYGLGIFLRCCSKNRKVPGLILTRRSAELRDPTLLRGIRWPSGWKYKKQWLTFGEWGCTFNNSPKLAVGQPNSSWKEKKVC